MSAQGTWPVVFLLFLAAALTLACGNGTHITWVNETDTAVGIYLDESIGGLEVVVDAGSQETTQADADTWRGVVIVRDVAGSDLLRRELTWGELEAQDFQFVIEPNDVAQP